MFIYFGPQDGEEGGEAELSTPKGGEIGLREANGMTRSRWME